MNPEFRHLESDWCERCNCRGHEPCASCGQIVHVGEFPFCPHGKSALASHGDDIPGGMWVENGFKDPIKVYSHSEHERKLAANGCELRPVWVPNDKHLSNWSAAVDAKTLDNVKVLLSRGGRAQKREGPPEKLVQALRDALYE